MDSLIERISYLTGEYVEKNGDPITSQWWGMGSPVGFFTIGVSIMIFCKVIGPQMMKNRKPYELDPWILIYNGNAFGAYSCAAAVATLCARWLSDSFKCHAYDPHTNSLPELGIKHFAYTLVLAKLYDFFKPVLSILAGKPQDVTNLQLLHCLGALMMTWYGVKVNPGGIFILIALMEAYFSALQYGYLVMTSASIEFRMTEEKKKMYKKFIFCFRMTQSLLTVAHSLYFVFQPNCHTLEIRIIGLAYMSLYTIFFPIDWYLRNQKKQKAYDSIALKKKIDDLDTTNNNRLSNRSEQITPQG